MVITNCTAALNTQQEFLSSLLIAFGNKGGVSSLHQALKQKLPTS
jgi:hypothetical protein